MDTIDITIKYKPPGWKEIMTGPEMALWIRSRSKDQWMNPFPGVFWISPKLFTLWQLEWIP